MKIRYFIFIYVFLHLFSCRNTATEPPLKVGATQQLADTLKKESMLPMFFYKRLEGILDNKLPIQMHLIRTDSSLIGNYVYTKIGQPLHFDVASNIQKQNIILREVAESKSGFYHVTGIFNGQFVNSQNITGTWIKPDSSTTLTFALQEKYLLGSHKLFIQTKKEQKGNCDTEQCMMLNLAYPLIQYENEQSELINQSIMQELAQQLTTGEAEFSSDSIGELEIDSMVNNLFLQHQAAIQRQEAVQNWDFQIQPKIFFNAHNLLSMGLEMYAFMGGAHGISYNRYLNFDVETGKLLSLNDLFRNGYQATLRRKVLKKLKNQHGLSDGEDLREGNFLVTDDDFELADNYYLSQGGITFFYNPYEIAPWALGDNAIFVSYSEVEGWIKRNSAVKRWFVL